MEVYDVKFIDMHCDSCEDRPADKGTSEEQKTLTQDTFIEDEPTPLPQEEEAVALQELEESTPQPKPQQPEEPLSQDRDLTTDPMEGVKVQDTVVEDIQEEVEDAVEDIQEEVEDAVEDIQEEVEDIQEETEDVIDVSEDTKKEVEDVSEDTKKEVEDLVDSEGAGGSTDMSSNSAISLVSGDSSDAASPVKIHQRGHAQKNSFTKRQLVDVINAAAIGARERRSSSRDSSSGEGE